MDKKKKINEILRETFPSCVNNHLRKVFGDLDFRTEWNIFSRSLVTSWDDNIPLGKNMQIKTYCDAYSEGFSEAITQTFFIEEKL